MNARIATLAALDLPHLVGWLGQGLFTLRMLAQWLASERARRAVVPRSFWTLSVAGTACLLVYQWHRADPVFLAGLLVHLAIYVRNLALPPEEHAAPGPPRRIWPAVLVGGAAFVVLLGAEAERFLEDADPVWLAAGAIGQAFWSGRFIVQWVASERAGRSRLPPAFFHLGLAGAVVLLAYAIHRGDWVMTLAFALPPVPYVRNLVLIHRHRRSRSA